MLLASAGPANLVHGVFPVDTFSHVEWTVNAKGLSEL